VYTVTAAVIVKVTPLFMIRWLSAVCDTAFFRVIFASGGSRKLNGKVYVWRQEPKNTFTKTQAKEKRKLKEWKADPSCRAIGKGAFQNNTKLKRVILPENVKEVGIQSFENTALRNVEMTAVESVQREAFRSCSHLKGVFVPSTVNFIGKEAFAQCRNLKEVEIAKSCGCSEIIEQTFQDCESLTAVTLPDSLKKIGDRAFYKCKALETIVLPTGLKEIGTQAFYQTGLTSLTLPDGLQLIGDSAFLKCNQLKYVLIPESVNKIEKWAFHGCNRLQVLEIRHDLKDIGPWIINKAARIRCRKGGTVDRYCREGGLTAEYIEE
jgi:hypothetical protein